MHDLYLPPKMVYAIDDQFYKFMTKKSITDSGQDINICPGQVVLHAGQVDHPKYLPDRTSKLKHIENDCLFVIYWHFILRVIFPRSPSGSLLLHKLNAWANHSMCYQCLQFRQRKVDRGWLVNVTWWQKFVHVLLFTSALPPCACVSQINIQQTKTPFFIQRC